MDGLVVDFYLLPSQEIRIGLSSASVALGYADNWLYRLTSRKGKSLKTLQSLGYTDLPVEVALDSVKGGGTKADTISLEDFQVLKIYAAQQGKSNAIRLLSFNALSSDIDIARELFGLNSLSVEEKRAIYYSDLGKKWDFVFDDKKDILMLIENDDRFASSLDYANWSLA